MEADGGVVDVGGTGARGLGGEGLLHLLDNPVGAGALQQAAVRGVGRRRGGLGQKVGPEVRPVVVSVLGVDLHGLDVEGGGGLYQLGEPLGVAVVRLPELSSVALREELRGGNT